METSWENSHSWYDKTVGEKGHYYHQSVIFPKTLNLLKLKKGDKLLDLACGQGVLARQLPPQVGYLGVDASSSLIKQAKGYSNSHAFILGDVTQEIKTPEKDFSHATVILALQNIEQPDLVLKNANLLLKPQGKLLIVLNHPCFRIPRQSSWGVDEAKKLQYRRIDRYLSPLKIPIQTHPGKQQASQETWSFHHPLSDYTRFLKEAGFAIELIEEWVSDKTSTGGHAKMENRSRAEFPLFLAILSYKLI